MKLECPTCGASIVADDVNLDRLVAKCRSCDSVFAFSPEASGAALERTAPRGPVEMPKRFRVERLGSELKITRRWFSPIFFFLVFFCLLWDGFLVVWYLNAGAAGIVFMLFPLIHVGVGVGLSYFTVCGFVNSTHVAANYESLRVRHGPLPWPGNRDVPRLDIDQLFTKEKVTQGKNGPSRTYELHAKLRSGKDVKLVSGLTEPDHARYMEQELERFLGIRDEPVAGELRA